MSTIMITTGVCKIVVEGKLILNICIRRYTFFSQYIYDSLINVTTNLKSHDVIGGRGNKTHYCNKHFFFHESK